MDAAMIDPLYSGVTASQALGGVLAAFGLLLLWQCFFVYDRIKLRHIAGPTPWPIIGNLADVLKHKDVGWNAYADWRSKHGRVFKWFFGPNPAVVVTDPELVRLVCVKHFRQFHDRSIWYAPQPRAFVETHRSGLTFVRGELWSTLKAAMQPMVNTEHLAHASRIVQETCTEAEERILAAAARSGASLEMHGVTAAVTLKVIGAAAFGLNLDVLTEDKKKRRENGVLVAASDLAVHSVCYTLRPLMFPRALRPIVWPLLTAFPSKRLANLRRGRSQLYMASIALTKNAMARMGVEWEDEIGMEKTFCSDNPDARAVYELYKDAMPCEGSAIDLLVRARNKAPGEGPAVKSHHIVSQAHNTLVAGHDTTSFTLTAALFFLATHPEAAAKLAAEVDAFGRSKPFTADDLPSFPYAEAVLKETLRLMPPGWLVTREAVEDVTVNGTYLPKGTVVHIDVYGLHRDPQQYADPLAFRPERFYDKDCEEAKTRHPYAWVPFGAGPRMCLGYKLATQEVLQVLVRLYQKFDFELDLAMTRLGPDGLPPLKSGVHMQFADGVYFRLHERPVLRAG